MSTAVEVAPYPPVDGTQPCNGEDPETFFPGSSSMDNYFKIPRAIEACGACPFRRPCLAYALTHDVDGIWGGTSKRERDALRKAHGIKAEAVHITDTTVLHQEIQLHASRGDSPSDIAKALGVSADTVSRHLRRIELS